MADREFIESKREMEALLRQETLGYLGLAAGGRPYVVPLNYVYTEGTILFHCALTGKKLDDIRANSQVCFTVGHQTGRVREHAGQDPCQLDSDSVICTGRARIVSSDTEAAIEERKLLLDIFSRRFDPDAAPISAKRAAKCGVVEIAIEEMTGRREREEGQTFWRHRFE
jgi:uncharacterized protein